MSAFFASRHCPGRAIRAALDWALQQAKARRVVAGGFHSPLEQSVLKLLLEAGGPAVVVLARGVEKARLPNAWQNALAAGALAVVSRQDGSPRLTAAIAAERNSCVAALADELVIAYAAPGSSIEALAAAQAFGKAVHRLPSALAGTSIV